MPTLRVPRGRGRTDWPFESRYENGTTPGYYLKPAKFLPVWYIDKLRNDAVVIPPGTFIGRLNQRDHTTVDSSFFTGGGSDDPLAPACPLAYTVTYSASDITDAVDDGYYTADLDANATTAVTAAGASSTDTQAGVKPLGITYRPYYSNVMEDIYENWDPDLGQAWVSGLHVVRIPCLTTGEMAVEAGDLVKLNDTTSPSWNPGNLTSSTPGRVHAYDAGALGDMEYVVGRCTNKVRLARQSSASAGQTLRAAIGTSAARGTYTNLNTTDTYLWPANENFKVASKSEGVPGLQLSATSATVGRPAEMLWARADSNGDFWAIDILLRV